MNDVIVTAEFRNFTPPHKRFVTKAGQGSNLDRAVRDAVQNIFKDDRLKNKKAANLLPCKMVIQIGGSVDTE